MWWTFKKKDAAKMADFHTNERKTQPSEVDFLKDEREKDATRIGGLSERKTQLRWRTFKTKERHNQSRWTFGKKDAAKMADFQIMKERHNQRWRTFNEANKGKTQPRWRTFTHEKKDATKDGGLSTKTKGVTQPTMADLTTKDEARNVFEVCINEEERRSQYGGLSICEGHYHKLY
jgi:hypothetical protein